MHRVKSFTQTWPSGRTSHNAHVRESFDERISTWDPFQRVPAWHEYRLHEVGQEIARYNYEYQIGCQ
jgi:hypothetical protein